MREPVSDKKFYAVIDFEATCWEDEDRRGDQEIIEIGAIKLRKEDVEMAGEFQTFVRPTRYPELSPFCIELTGIPQEAVDRAPTFPYSLTMLEEWLGDPADYTFCSWGDFDQYILRAACRFHRVPFPFDDEYLDIKPLFAEQVRGRSTSMEHAMEILGLAPHGSIHRALDDARNITRIFQVLIRDSRA